QPILLPKKEHPWEAAAVFNCAAIYDNGLVHMIYRAADIAPNGKEGLYINCLGYAVSKDGIHFNRLEQPILFNDVEQEARGPEDPRIVKIGDTFYMMYTGYGGRFPEDFRICLATSKNLIDWERQGIVLDEPNKDASLFPEKIKDKYVMFHRREPDIWIAYSDDLKTWYDHKIIMKPIPDSDWEYNKIGIAGPPIKTEQGWFLIYHGTSNEKDYCLGAALLDLDDPSKVLARQAEPILEPELDWEVNGYIPKVVFSCGQAEIGDKILVYYGGADTVIGVAELDKKYIKFD
ncbi:unnamed protein product, partial [marine sediment metagenome]